MTRQLFIQAILKFFAGAVFLGVLTFLPAGTLHYWNAWLLMGILFIPMFLAGIVLMFKNPDLLKKRLNAKEKEAEQSLVIKLSGLMFVLGVRGSRAELPLSVDCFTGVGFLGSDCRFPALLLALCRGTEGKHLSFKSP